MRPGDVVLVRLEQIAGAGSKLRPALILASLPGPYQNVVLCGISTRMHQQQIDWDELIRTTDTDFGSSGLHHESVIRLSYLYSVEQTEIVGRIGSINDARLQRLRRRLAEHLTH